MFSIIETFATAILLLLLMMFILHVIRGDAADWVTSKFRIDGPEETTASIPSAGGSTPTDDGIPA